jgi:predicted small secreted protein
MKRRQAAHSNRSRSDRGRVALPFVLVLLGAFSLGLAPMAGCETIEGAGEDIENAGEELDETIDE